MEQSITKPKALARPVATRVEWPTVLVAAAIVGLFAVAFLTHEVLPAPLTVALLAVAGAWYGSLQHEVIHGHPTPWSWFNVALAAAPLTLLVPFNSYRESHLRHHVDADLTDPINDPESSYVTRAQWERSGSATRVLRIALRTSLGYILLKPALTVACRLRDACHAPTGAHRWAEMRSLGAVLCVLICVDRLGLPLWQFAFGAYFAHSLTAVRSFAEHRAVASGSRTAVVRAGLFWRLLFLNNSLHITHHARPSVAWYELPAVHEHLDLEPYAAKGAGLYQGYGEVLSRYLVRPVDDVVHPRS